MSGCKFDFAIRKGTKPGSNFISQKLIKWKHWKFRWIIGHQIWDIWSFQYVKSFQISKNWVFNSKKGTFYERNHYKEFGKEMKILLTIKNKNGMETYQMNYQDVFGNICFLLVLFGVINVIIKIIYLYYAICNNFCELKM